MDNEKLSQVALIGAYLQSYGSITVREARKPPICCERLAARIADLRKAGVPIITERREKKSPVTGKMVVYAVYRLEGTE